MIDPFRADHQNQLKFEKSPIFKIATDRQKRNHFHAMWSYAKHWKEKWIVKYINQQFLLVNLYIHLEIAKEILHHDYPISYTYLRGFIIFMIEWLKVMITEPVWLILESELIKLVNAYQKKNIVYLVLIFGSRRRTAIRRLKTHRIFSFSKRAYFNS